MSASSHDVLPQIYAKCTRHLHSRLDFPVNFSHKHTSKKRKASELTSGPWSHGLGRPDFSCLLPWLLLDDRAPPRERTPRCRLRAGSARGSRAARSHRAPRVSGRRLGAPAATRAPPAVRSPPYRPAPCGGRRTGDSRAFRSQSKQTE
jgi:hypothetical protein